MTGRFSKRDWQDIAAYLRAKISHYHTFTLKVAFMQVADEAAALFGRDSVHFDRGKFLRACGIQAPDEPAVYVIRKIVNTELGKQREVYWSNVKGMWVFDKDNATVFTHREVLEYPATPAEGEWVVR